MQCILLLSAVSKYICSMYNLVGLNLTRQLYFDFSDLKNKVIKGSKSSYPLLTIQCVFKIVKVGTRRKLSVKEIMASVLSAMFGVTKAEK